MIQTTRLFLATLVLGTLMMMLASLPVSAGGGAKLTADQNPVLIQYGQTTGKVTLTWDAGIAGNVEFWDSVNGAPESGPFPQPAVGTDTDTLKVNETVLYRMYTPGKGQLLAALTVTAKMYTPVPYCSVNLCIENVHVTQGFNDDGGYMDITWETTLPAGAIVAISKLAEISEVDGNEFAHVDGAALQIERTGPKHFVHIGGLQNSTYHYIIEAIDANGNKTKYHGSYSFYGYI